MKNLLKKKLVKVLSQRIIITIVVLIILAGVGLNLTLGENGIFNKAKYARENTQKAKEREQLELVLQEAYIEREENLDYNNNNFLNEFIQVKIKNSKIDGNEVTVEQFSFLIDRDKLIIVDEIDNTKKREEQLIEKAAKITVSGNYEIEVNGTQENGTEETKKYNVNQIVFDGDLILDGLKNVNGATLQNNVYEFGNKAVDVANETDNARNMVILKVNGNLTIEEGITLTACKSDDGYGGPKGMLIYCTGTLTNKGTISMTARGAKAEGENVYLWMNSDGICEYVPAVGATGGESRRAGESQYYSGNAGNEGEGRQTRWTVDLEVQVLVMPIQLHIQE